MGKRSDDPRVIKRYANRKLYDTAQRRFTTLDELAGLIENGLNVVVTDHESGADRTQDVLAQVFGRRIKTGSGDADALSNLLRSPAAATAALASDLLGPLTAPPKAKSSSGKKSSKSKAKPAAPKKKKSTPKASAGDATQDELVELRKQVSELTSVVHLLLKERSGDSPE